MEEFLHFWFFWYLFFFFLKKEENNDPYSAAAATASTLQSHWMILWLDQMSGSISFCRGL